MNRQNAVLPDDVHRSALPRIRMSHGGSCWRKTVTDENCKQKHIKDLVTQSAMHVLDNGGTVRGFRYWGTLTLPQRMKRQKQFFNYGEYVPPFSRQRTAEKTPAPIPHNASKAADQNRVQTVTGSCTSTRPQRRSTVSTPSSEKTLGLFVGRCSKKGRKLKT